MRAWFDGRWWYCEGEGDSVCDDRPRYLLVSGHTLREAIDSHNQMCGTRRVGYEGFEEFLDLTPAECLASTDPRLQDMVRWHSGDTGNCVHAVLLGGTNDRFSEKTREEFDAAHKELATTMKAVIARLEQKS